MNISKLALDNVIRIELKHPNTGKQLFNDDESKMEIVIAGVRTEKYKKEAKKHREELGVTQLLIEAQKEDASPELRAECLDKIAESTKLTALSCIESVNIDGEKQGEKVSVKSLLEWIGKPSHEWIIDQIILGVQNGEGFIQA